MTLLSSRRAKYPSESRSPYLPSRSLIRAASAAPSRALGSGRAQEQVHREDQGEDTEPAGEDAEQVAARLRHPLNRPGRSHQAVHDLLHPLAQRVVGRQPPGQDDVGEADDDVGDDHAGEHPQRPPPGTRIPLGVELVPEVQQRDEQDQRDDGRRYPLHVRVRVIEVDADVEGEQREHGLVGAPLPAAQPVGQHQQHQPDDHVDGADAVGQRARDQVADLGQPVRPLGLEDRDDVRQADERGQQGGGTWYPGTLPPAVNGVTRCRGRLHAAPPGQNGAGRVSSFVAVGHLGGSLVRPKTTPRQRSHSVASRPAFTVPPKPRQRSRSAGRSSHSAVGPGRGCPAGTAG